MAGLSLVLLIAAGLLVWALTRDDTYVAPKPSTARPSASPALATQTLERFVRAVRTGDAKAAEELAPDDDRRTAGHLAALVRNAGRLEVEDFTLRYVDADGIVAADGTWTAAVDATWELAGFDRSAAHAEVTVHLRDDGARVALTGIGGGGRVSPLWLSGPVQVRRTFRTLVVVDGDAAEARRYARLARTAVPAVRAVVPRWRRGLVVEVPSSLQELNRTLDAERGTYQQIAAVTTSADGTLTPDAPVHVFVNPDVYGGLKPTGSQVVMTHEATHVATGAWTSDMPLWLLEGFADYVALREVDLPVRTSASQIIAEVRRDGAPRSLPAADDFGTRTPNLGATYESAWLACRLLAQDGGQDALLRFYRAVDDGRPVPAALESTFGLSLAGFTRQWRTLLTDLAG